mmetsp:Transcript_11135/g.41604  ORF Transcript_11135/g.41604 Transcript_11135/m.41604 type:complete len:572 (-) Transcript_11135:96-1811(-)
MSTTRALSENHLNPNHSSTTKCTSEKDFPRSPMQASPDSSNSPVSSHNELLQEPPVAKPRATPLPWAHLVVVFIIFVTDVLAMTSLTPYLPFLVESFGVVHDRTKLGYVAGLVASSYYFAQLFSSIFWGWVSDRVGRRPVMLIGCFSSCVCSLAFGFSRTLSWALVCRLSYGGLNGILGSMKTSLSEVTDKTNQAKAFSYIGLSFGIGQFLGPLMGGTLALPVETYPSLFLPSSPLYPIKSFLEYFPFFLPNFVIFLVTLCGTIIGLFLLNESNQDVLDKRERKKKAADEQNLLRHVNTHPGTPSAENLNQEDTPIKPVEKRSFFASLKQSEILSTPAPLTTSLIYSTLGFNSVLFSEVLPLWAVLSPKKWGIDFNSSDLGVLMSASGIFILFFNLIFLHKIIDRIGALNTLRTGALLGMPFLCIFPEISLFFFPRPAMFLVWSTLFILVLIRQLTSQLCFSPSIMMINNSVTFRSMGTINGISQSAVAFMRALSPALGGSVFAMSVNNNIIPFDVHLVWVWMALNNLITMSLSFLLPKSINEPKNVPATMETELNDDEPKDIEMTAMGGH